MKMKYPYMTYDDEAKAIYIYLSEEIKKGKYQISKTLEDTNDMMINLDLDKDDNVLGIEILLS